MIRANSAPPVKQHPRFVALQRQPRGLEIESAHRQLWEQCFDLVALLTVHVSQGAIRWLKAFGPCSIGTNDFVAVEQQMDISYP